MPPSESEELAQARQCIIEGKFEECLQLINDFEKRKNNSLDDIVSCHLVKCNLLLHQGLFEELVKFAEQTYKESLGLEKSILSVDILIIMANALILIFDLTRAKKIIEQVQELLASLTDEPAIDKNLRDARLVYLKTLILNPYYSPKGDVELALKKFKHTIALGESLGDDILVCTSLLHSSWILAMYKGEIDKGLEHIERILAYSKEANYKLFISNALLYKAVFYHNKGEITRSIPLYEQSLAIAKEINHKRLISVNLNNMADAYRMNGELEHALECSERSLARSSKIGNLQRVAFFHDNLIQILIEMGDLDQAEDYLSQLEQVNSQLKDKNINLVYLYNKAILLKESPRISNRGKAEEILKQILKNEDIFRELKERALLSLCELLIVEFQMSNVIEVLDEIKSLIVQLFETVEKSKSYWILCETYLLQAKIALISSDLKRARRLLAKGQQIAEKFGLIKLAMSISEEHDKLLKELSLWERLNETNAPLKERLELARINDQVVKMIRKRVIDRSKTEAEQPVFLSIMTKEGDMVLSSPFSADMTIDETQFGEFLSSCNYFCDQIFSESFDRVKFGRYTILITAIEPFCVYYMFQGHSYSAQQKLAHFSEAINKDINIMNLLEDASSKKKVIKINEINGLEELIFGSFLSDPEQFQMPFKAYAGEDPFVFASYSHTDRLQVYPIIDYLNKTGINIWYDEGIPVSENWKKSIVENLERCSSFLVFITPHTIDSEYVRKEISFALKKKKPFFGVYLKETELPSELEFDIADIQSMKKFLMSETEFYAKLREMIVHE
jgi:tetratricopeptide (TPR) repeat protein